MPAVLAVLIVALRREEVGVVVARGEIAAAATRADILAASLELLPEDMQSDERHREETKDDFPCDIHVANSFCSAEAILLSWKLLWR